MKLRITCGNYIMVDGWLLISIIWELLGASFSMGSGYRALVGFSRDMIMGKVGPAKLIYLA